MRQVATRAFFATSLYRGSKSPGTAILRNQEARGATSAKRVPQDVPTAEIGQRTKLSGLDRPKQDSPPLSWRAQNKGLQIPVRDLARLSDIIIGYMARRSGTQYTKSTMQVCLVSLPPALYSIKNFIVNM